MTYTSKTERQKDKPIILIVDDVPKNIQVLGTLLNKFECELAVAMNGQQALDTVKKIMPDLILLDIMMPQMDGHEVCRRLKNDEVTKDIPIIFLTAKIETEDVVKGFELGAVDYVTKPFIGRELLARVKTHLDYVQIKKSLKDEVASKNKFLSIISHDLRSSFGTVSSFVSLIKENRNTLSEEEMDDFLNDIDKTTRNTLELLENLLSWARAQTGIIKKQPKEFAIGRVINELVRASKKSSDKKAIQLTAEFGDDVSNVFADKNMTSLILRNLLSNAIKFTTKNGTIQVKAENNEENVKISVIDTGVGIAPEKVEKIFDIDQKVSTYGTENEEGNGLGLILCREFVIQNNGEIGIQSEENKGTNVWFTIPKFENVNSA